MNLSVTALTFDCADASGLAHFWSGVLGLPVDPEPSESFASIGQSSGTQPSWMFNKVPEPKKTKNRMHVDLSSADWDADVDRVLALGATRIGGYDESGMQWVTLADPEGNEFDVVAGEH
ncbi:MAG: VOC family protein [Acidimicrobiales bacterium]